MSVSRACNAVNFGRSSWYREPVDWAKKDAPVIDAINEVLDSRVRARWGFWKCDGWLDQKQRGINHKRLWRVYKAMGLNLQRKRTKKRVPARVKQPLAAPAQVDHQWSMDFMADSLYCGRSFRTLNLFDEGTREVLAIEVDTSLPAARVIRVLEQLKDSRQLPTQIRVDNGPEFDSAKLHAWCDTHNINLHFIERGRPMQNGYVERRTATSNASTAASALKSWTLTPSAHSKKSATLPTNGWNATITNVLTMLIRASLPLSSESNSNNKPKRKPNPRGPSKL